MEGHLRLQLENERRGPRLCSSRNGAVRLGHPVLIPDFNLDGRDFLSAVSIRDFGTVAKLARRAVAVSDRSMAALSVVLLLAAVGLLLVLVLRRARADPAALLLGQQLVELRGRMEELVAAQCEVPLE